jgi:hypothetical protein
VAARRCKRTRRFIQEGQTVGQQRAGTALPKRRQPWRLLLSLLGAILLVLLSPERPHAAERPAPVAAAVPQGTAMQAGIADTPAARLLAAVRSLLTGEAAGSGEVAIG